VARSFRIAALLTFAAMSAFAAPPASKSPTPEQIQKAVDDLQSPRFPVRERASKALWDAGAAAEPALREAAKSKDEETANRAKTILDKFDWGLYPDTPPEVARYIEKFRGGEPAVRQEAVGELMRMKPPRFATLRKLVAQEKDETARQQMHQTMLVLARQAVPGLIVANSLDDAAEMLEICLASGQSIAFTDYAAFHYLRDKVPDAIRRMESLQKTGSKADVRLASEALVYLHRVRNDWPAARKAAADTGVVNVIEDVAWESNDWKTLATLPREVEGARDDRGAQAAYHRLAGNKAEYDKLIEEMRKDLGGVEGDDGSAYLLAHALLLNGDGAEAIKVLKGRSKRGSDLMFDLLCAQLKFKEAFAYSDKVAKELEKDDEAVFEKQRLAMRRGTVLYALGDKDAATQVFRGILDRALAGQIQDTNAFEIVKTVARTGMRDLAAECAGRAIAHFEKTGRREDISAYLQPVFEGKRHAVQVWWNALRVEKPDEDPVARMTRLLDFADGKADRKKVDRLAELVDKLKPGPKDIVDGTASTILFGPSGVNDYAVAEAYRLAGVDAKAEEYFKKAIDDKSVTLGPLPAFPAGLDISIEDDDDDFPWCEPTMPRFVLGYADFLLTRKRPKEAAVYYRKVWDMSPTRPLSLFLHGHALKLAGDEVEGKRLMELAHWVPLGNESTRAKFSENLSARGFDADSRREMDLVLNTGWFRSYAVGNVQLRMARIKARQKDYETAARYFEKDVIGVVRTGAHFVDDRAYLTVPELARTYRARALFAAGKIDAGLAEARTGLAILPGNVEMAIGLVPDLDKAGKKAEADEIYSKVKDALADAIKDYGSSHDLRNSLAWMMVNCNRDLDEALAHAKKAVELAPKSAGYIDTLAEIHFRKKDRAKALELMKQCAALEPGNPYYRKQLERFEKKPFDSPLPDEETGDE
jgi:tetratricopeptide (TPR) repeat protein